jgi:hypothetical protein
MEKEKLASAWAPELRKDPFEELDASVLPLDSEYDPLASVDNPKAIAKSISETDLSSENWRSKLVKRFKTDEPNTPQIDSDKSLYRQPALDNLMTTDKDSLVSKEAIADMWESSSRGVSNEDIRTRLHEEALAEDTKLAADQAVDRAQLHAGEATSLVRNERDGLNQEIARNSGLLRPSAKQESQLQNAYDRKDFIQQDETITHQTLDQAQREAIAAAKRLDEQEGKTQTVAGNIEIGQALDKRFKTDAKGVTRLR